MALTSSYTYIHLHLLIGPHHQHLLIGPHLLRLRTKAMKTKLMNKLTMHFMNSLIPHILCIYGEHLDVSCFTKAEEDDEELDVSSRS